MSEGHRFKVDLSAYGAGGFDRGASRVVEGLWRLTQAGLFQACPFGLYALKRAVLRAFGARIGRGVVLKPGVKITFPWKLELGDHVWVGEEAWLHNLDPIIIGSHACVSQRAMLCAGSHDYRAPTFDLRTAPIRVGEGAWVAAMAWVGPGVTIGSHAVLAAGSVAGRDLEPYGVYRGNPAGLVGERAPETPV
ncbi:MAG: WcaF family extracellular polysaccharide biosynthesis acetyltransferase [Planctomycetes bacterium]|nr:WcaF family extracellular polysaccharide biosynthesis acetyltransferase [Planctomycetota bacterium]